MKIFCGLIFNLKGAIGKRRKGAKLLPVVAGDAPRPCPGPPATVSRIII